MSIAITVLEKFWTAFKNNVPRKTAKKEKFYKIDSFSQNLK